MLSLTAGYGEYAVKRTLKALGISRDRLGRYRIRRPDEPRLPGTWDRDEYLKTFIIAYILATDDVERQKIVRLVYEYLGVPYTPVVAFRAKPRLVHQKMPHEMEPPCAPDVTASPQAPVIPLNIQTPATAVTFESAATVIPITEAGREESAEHAPPRAIAPLTLRARTRTHLLRPLAPALEELNAPHDLFGFILIAFGIPSLILILLMLGWWDEHRQSSKIAGFAGEEEARAEKTEDIVLSRANPLLSFGRSSEAQPRPPANHYVFDVDDTLWDVAHATLGKRARKKEVWRYAEKIARANAIRVPEWGIATGIRDARRLPPGLIIILP